MKITKDEFKRSEEKSALELFRQGIKADETKEKYTRTLRRILCVILEDFLEGSFDQRANQIVKMAREDPKWIMDLLLNLSKKLRERTTLAKDHPDYLNPSSIDNYFKPIRKLLDMNDVTLSWKRIHVTFPEIDNITQTREWTREEIQDMLKFANGSIDRAIVLIAASSGIRSGAFKLHWEDVIPIYKINDQLTLTVPDSKDEVTVACAMIIVYKGTSEQYPAFITDEAYNALLDYMNEWKNKIGRWPLQEDPIFLNEGDKLKMASIASIKRRVERLVKRAGFREPLGEGQKRHEVPIMNGFRRFFNKTIKQEISNDSPLASLIKKEYMMGHTGLVKLDRNYFKTNALELAREYLDASHALIISDENRLQIENKNLKEERNDLADTNLIRNLQRRIEELECGKEAREAHYAKTKLSSEEEDCQKALGDVFALSFELTFDEEYKRKYWKEFITSQKENRPMNRARYDPDYIELSEEEKRDRSKYVQKELQKLDAKEKHQNVHEEVKTGSLKDVWHKRPKFNHKRQLEMLLE